jgi:hypothetical protein
MSLINGELTFEYVSTNNQAITKLDKILKKL